MSDLKKIEPVAAYIRVSTQEQKLHGLSIDAQQMKLQEYADKNNMKIVEWYIDSGVSGRKPIRKRPELQRMITDAEKSLFERIIFIKIDRFFRSVAEYHECMKRISPVVWTTTEEKYDLTTANGRMFVNMKLTIAELEADQTGERIRIVNDYKVQVGRPLVGDKCLPFGFKNYVDETGIKRVGKDESRQLIVKDMLEHIFKHQSIRKTLIYLREKYDTELWYESLTKLLRNTMLCGEYRGNKNYCAAYISRDEFDKLQYIVAHQVKHNTVNRDYIFSGLIRCPCCGSVMVGCPLTTINPNKKRYQYKRYRCTRFHNQRACTNKKFVNETVLEKKLLAQVVDFLNAAKLKAVKVDSNQEEPNTKKLLENLKAQVTRLNYSWQTGKILDVAQYEKQYAELIVKIEELQKVRPIEKKKNFKHVEKILCDGWQDTYLKLSDANKRAFWRSFIKSIHLQWTTETKEIVDIEFK